MRGDKKGHRPETDTPADIRSRTYENQGGVLGLLRDAVFHEREAKEIVARVKHDRANFATQKTSHQQLLELGIDTGTILNITDEAGRPWRIELGRFDAVGNKYGLVGVRGRPITAFRLLNLVRLAGLPGDGDKSGS